ncbi:efflux RND transporter periplasmic adaptor subunit [uncultured Pseudoteredinibacter sp.]|uniref:efflux RND transporter periplasmic adaptor subunit n=1 Tax=uncultured Pseudoteredinibacter sp. TaxID=1641701 RepID=UPI00263493A8|nr:efflux RND transporter periplasmic adaptor subunit [uncultured Pseudoteredinibacter sp.]
MKQQRLNHSLKPKKQVSKVLALFILGTCTAGNLLNAQVLERPKVKTAKVETWQASLNKTLYCVVDTPQLFQGNSHSNSELINILPVGTQLKAGDVVATQDDFYLSQELKQLAIDERLAQAELDHARNEQQRLTVLDRKEMISKAQLSEATLKQTRAKLELDSLKNKKRTLKRRIERLTHRAPFSAQLLRVDAEPGQHLNPGQSLFQLLPLNQKRLECKLPLDIAKELNLIDQNHLDTRLEFSLSSESSNALASDTNRNHHLLLRELSQTADRNTQNLQIYLELHKQHPNLLIGQRVKVNVQQQHTDISRVPYDAITLSGNSYELWQLKPDNTVTKIYPHIVSTSKDYFIVRSPLRAGDKVITRGQQGLKEKQQVSELGEQS